MESGFFDDESRTYTPVVDAADLPPRPYTPEENAAADARALAAANREALRAGMRADIDTLLTATVNLRAVIDKTNSTLGPADTKAVARESRSIARILIRVLRVVGDVLDSTDSGTP